HCRRASRRGPTEVAVSDCRARRVDAPLSAARRTGASMRVTVVCVLWMGEFQDRHYSPAWVTRLRDMVAACLPLSHRFICLSNVDIPGVETQPLRTGWPGWWAKLEMFDPSRDFGDRILYLDL